MTVIRFLFRAFSVRVAVAIAFGLAAGACSAALIASIAAGLHGTAQHVVAAFAIIAAARITTEFLANVQLHFVANETIGELRLRLAKNILRAPLRTLEQVGSPRLLGALTEDAQIVGNAARSIVAIATALGLIVGAAGYLAWLSPALGAFVVVCLAGAATLYRRLHARGARAMQSAMGLRMRMFGALSGSVRGIHELKLHRKRREAFHRNAVDSSLRAFHAKLVDSFRLFAWAESINLTVFFAVVGVIVFVWPHLSPSSAAQMPAYVLALLYLPAPFELVLEQLPQLAQASATVNDLDKLGLSLQSSAEPEGAGVPAGAWKSIELRGVVHRFRSEDDREFTLGPLDLRLSPGEIVYVTGGNGSGKTTLAKILVGFYAPEAGEIVADGQTVEPSALGAYRERFGAIFSEFRVFDRPYGAKSDSLDEDARKLLARLSLDDRVKIEGGVYSTTNLSEGQRARLALTTALLQDRSIYVLDEWAAHQDPELKALYYEKLLPELKSRGKTIVAITHDDRYFHLADRVLRLEEGKVVTRS